MTAKTTKRRTAMSGALGSKALERLLIVAAVAAVLVAFGAWYAMGRPAEADAASSPSAAARGAASGETVAAEPTAPEEAAPPSSEAAVDAPAAPESAATPAPAAPAAETPAPSPQTFLDEVSDSGLAPPVDDAQKLAMARDLCEEMGYGATPDDMVRALTFSGATDAEAANFVQLAITNVCPEHAGR